MVRSFFLLLVAASVWSSCLSYFFKSDPPKDLAFEYSAPASSKWQSEDPGEADVLYRKIGAQASISVNTVCDQVQNRSLEDLVDELSGRIDEKQEIERHSLRVKELPALQTHLKGVVDSQPISIIFTVARSRSCIYDFILAASPEITAEDLAQYDAIMQSFIPGKK